MIWNQIYSYKATIWREENPHWEEENSATYIVQYFSFNYVVFLHFFTDHMSLIPQSDYSIFYDWILLWQVMWHVL